MCKNYNRIPVSVSLTIVYILLLTKCLRQTAPAGHGHTVGDTGRGHMVCAGLPQTGSLHHLPQEPEIWKKQKNIFTQLHWRSWQSAGCCLQISPESRPSSRSAGGAAGGPGGPGAPGAAVLSCAGAVGAGELSVCAAAVVAVHLMRAARGPALTRRVQTVTLPHLNAHAVLQQLAYTHNTRHFHASDLKNATVCCQKAWVCNDTWVPLALRALIFTKYFFFTI